MATSSQAKTLLGGLNADIKKALGNVLDYVLNNSLAFGPITSDAAQTTTTNFAGRWVKVKTSATANQETAVAHGLGRPPNAVLLALNPRVVGSKVLGDLTVSKAADDQRLYVTSASTSATGWVYLE